MADHASHHPVSFQPRNSSPSPSSHVKSLAASNRPADLESSILGFGEESPDPDVEHALRLQTQERILQRQADLEQEKRQHRQKVRQMEAEIYQEKLLLGPAEPPAHLEEKNFFDEIPTRQLGENQDSRSPGDMTLVEPELESILENQPPVASPFTRPISGLTDSAPGNGNSNAVDIMMKDLMPEQNIRSDTPTYTGDRKRKRFSFLPAAKKARTSEHAPFLNVKLDSNTSMLQHGPIESIGNASAHLKDTDKPTTTTRPTSWPRSRLFRRSAGVSVKKITDVFEKLRLQHDKPVPAAPQSITPATDDTRSTGHLHS